MKMNSLKIIVGVFALSLILTACGNEGAITGLDTKAELSELTDEEQKLACENSGTYMEENAGEATKRFGCMMAASMAASLTGGEDYVTTCQESFDSCLVAPAQEEEQEEEGCEVQDLSDCSGTVADLELCYDSMVNQLNKVAEELKCEEPQQSNSSSSTDNPFLTAECSTLVEACPAFGPEESTSEE